MDRRPEQRDDGELAEQGRQPGGQHGRAGTGSRAGRRPDRDRPGLPAGRRQPHHGGEVVRAQPGGAVPRRTAGATAPLPRAGSRAAHAATASRRATSARTSGITWSPNSTASSSGVVAARREDVDAEVDVVEQRRGDGLRACRPARWSSRRRRWPSPCRCTGRGRGGRPGRRSRAAAASRCSPATPAARRKLLAAGLARLDPSHDVLRPWPTPASSVGARIGRNATWMRGGVARPAAAASRRTRSICSRGVGQRLAPEAEDVGLGRADGVGRVRGPAEARPAAAAAGPGRRRPRSRRSGSARPCGRTARGRVHACLRIWMYSRVRS